MFSISCSTLRIFGRPRCGGVVCNCSAGQLRKEAPDTESCCCVAATVLAERSSLCGFSIRNICHSHFKSAVDYSNQRHSSQPFGMIVVSPVCLCKCYCNIRIGALIRAGKHYCKRLLTPLDLMLFTHYGNGSVRNGSGSS